MENGFSQIDVTLTPLMMAMAIPISFAIQFIKALAKKVSFFEAEEIKKSFFPMVSIALTMAAYRLAGIEEWLLAGIVMGLAASGGYQAFAGTAKLIKKPTQFGTGSGGCKKTLVCILLCFLLLTSGCLWAENPKADLLASQKTFTATVDSLTALQNAGKFEPEDTEHLTVLIHSGQGYLIAWEDALKAGNDRPDAIALFQAVLDQLLEYSIEKGD